MLATRRRARAGRSAGRCSRAALVEAGHAATSCRTRSIVTWPTGARRSSSAAAPVARRGRRAHRPRRRRRRGGAPGQAAARGASFARWPTTVWPPSRCSTPITTSSDVARYLPDCAGVRSAGHRRVGLSRPRQRPGVGAGPRRPAGRGLRSAGRARRAAATRRDGAIRRRCSRSSDSSSSIQAPAPLRIANLTIQARRSRDAFRPRRARGRDASSTSSPAPRCPTRAPSSSPATTRATIATDTEWLVLARSVRDRHASARCCSRSCRSPRTSRCR